MSFEEYVEDLCKFDRTTIVYHKHRTQDIEKKFDNEMLITFPSNSNGMLHFIDNIKEYEDNSNCCWVKYFGEEIMKEYDALYLWWNDDVDE